MAKHSIALTYDELLTGISRLLAYNGSAAIVLPVFNLETFEAIAVQYNLFVTQLTEVTAVSGKPPYLVLLQLKRNKRSYLKDCITIQDATGNFTDDYKILTKDFYLKF